MKNAFTFILGATVGAVAYHLLVATAEKAVEVVVESVAS